MKSTGHRSSSHADFAFCARKERLLHLGGAKMPPCRRATHTHTQAAAQVLLVLVETGGVLRKVCSAARALVLVFMPLMDPLRLCSSSAALCNHLVGKT